MLITKENKIINNGKDFSQLSHAEKLFYQNFFFNITKFVLKSKFKMWWLNLRMTPKNIIAHNNSTKFMNPSSLYTAIILGKFWVNLDCWSHKTLKSIGN
jgi:hypothetical protein